MRPSLVVVTLVLAAFGCGGCTRPEGIVEDAVEAARHGDREAYLQCFTARSRALLRSFWLVASPEREDLFALSAGDVQVGPAQPLPADSEGTPRIAVPITEGRATKRVVLHGRAGAWRIDLVDTERVLTGLGAPF